MKTQTDNLFMGYMDGELSLGEVAEVDNNFTESQRVRLQKEIQFESKLLDALGTKLCPDDLWKSTLAKIHASDKPASTSTSIISFVSRPAVWLAIAASVAILLGSFQMTHANSSFLNQVTTVAALATETSEIPPEQLLADNDIALAIASVSADCPHDIKIIGGCNCSINGEQVTVINFSCCGEAQRVLIARIGGKASKAMLHKKNFNNIQIMEKLGDYQLALIGNHPGQEVLNLFKDV